MDPALRITRNLHTALTNVANLFTQLGVSPQVSIPITVQPCCFFVYTMLTHIYRMYSYIQPSRQL